MILSTLVLSPLTSAHNLAGCWSGPGWVTLVGMGKQACARIAIKHEFSTTGLVMKALAMDCPNFDRSWEEKVFEIRNGNEIWGGDAEKAILGTLDKDAYWFDDPQNAVQFIEYKADRNPSTGRMTWLESFASTQKIYWKVEGELSPVACEGL